MLPVEIICLEIVWLLTLLPMITILELFSLKTYLALKPQTVNNSGFKNNISQNRIYYSSNCDNTKKKSYVRTADCVMCTCSSSTYDSKCVCVCVCLPCCLPSRELVFVASTQMNSCEPYRKWHNNKVSSLNMFVILSIMIFVTSFQPCFNVRFWVFF